MPGEYNWGVRLRDKIFNALKGESSFTSTNSDIPPSASPPPPAMRSTNSSTNANTLNQFDDRWLLEVRSRTRTNGRRNGASMGLGLGAICLLPFGPIAMFVCAIGGLFIGFLLGIVYDMKQSRRRDSEAEKELRRLSYLVRFSTEQISRRIFTHESDEDSKFCLDLLVDVILEFKPFVELPHMSPTLHKRLLLLHSFLSRKAVLQCLWMYVNNFLSKWTTSLTVMEFMETCSNVLYTLIKLEDKLEMKDPRKRLEVIVRVEDFLNDPAIKGFYAAHATPSGGPSKKNLEAVLVQEARRSISDIRRRRGGSMHSAVASAVDEELAGVYQDTLEELDETNIMSPINIERPFFKSFKDFMEFDLDLKHRMPILASESRFIYEKEAEPLDGPGWDLTVNRPLIKVLRYIETSSGSSASSPPVLVRAYAKIPNTTMENVFYHISDTVQRTEWDTTFADFSLIPEGRSPSCDILYCMLNSPFGVTPRDFLQYRRTIVKTDSITLLMRSAEHPAKPSVSGCIRAETYISGYVIRQSPSGCDLFLMSQTDIKGLIPKWIVNMMAAKAPAQWVNNLARSCAKLKNERFSGNETLMHAFLRDYVDKKNFNVTNHASTV